MEPTRFDDLSRSLATHANRRDALRGLGAGGVAAGLLSLFGLRASAQADNPVTCILDFHAETATGPNEDTVYDGILTLVIESDGAIDDATLEMDDEEYDVVGQAIGRALSLHIELDDSLALSLHGVGERDIKDCRGDVAGTFGGPEMRDLGTWQAKRKSGITVTGGSAAKTPTAKSGGTSGGQPTPTPKPCPPKDCGPTFVQDPITCECGCPKPYDRCGDICCFGGAECDAANASCQCPAGTEPCQEVCTQSCTSGETLDQATCKCVAGCGGMTCQYSGTVGQTLDPATCTCVDTCTGEFPYFCGGTCNGEPMAYCGGLCTTFSSVSSDVNNCGCLGVKCPAGVPCIGGVCQCPYGYSACGSGCSDLTDTKNCGACDNACPGGVSYDVGQFPSLPCESGGCCVPATADCSGGIPCCGLLTCYDHQGGLYCD